MKFHLKLCFTGAFFWLISAGIAQQTTGPENALLTVGKDGSECVFLQGENLVCRYIKDSGRSARASGQYFKLDGEYVQVGKYMLKLKSVKRVKLKKRTFKFLAIPFAVASIHFNSSADSALLGIDQPESDTLGLWMMTSSFKLIAAGLLFVGPKWYYSPQYL